MTSCCLMNIMLKLFFLLLLLIIVCIKANDDDDDNTCNELSSKSPNLRLKKYLFCNYDATVRPIIDHNNKTEITIIPFVEGAEYVSYYLIIYLIYFFKNIYSILFRMIIRIHLYWQLGYEL